MYKKLSSCIRLSWNSAAELCSDIYGIAETADRELYDFQSCETVKYGHESRGTRNQ
jgi:hypothetical protein